MLAFLIRRAAQGAAVMLAAAVISFALLRFVGDPVAQLTGVDSSIDAQHALRRQLGLDDALMVQLARHVLHLLQLDLGISYQLKLPVTALLAERLPATLELAGSAMLLALLFGVPAGVYCGAYPDTAIARLLQGVTLLGISLPTFLVGMLLIWVFSVQLGWLPSFGRGQTVRLGAWTTGLLTPSGLRSLVLPAVTLGLFQATLVLRLVRVEMLAVMQQDFVRFARACGLPERTVLLDRALRAAMVPVLTLIGLQLGSMIAFALVTESVFQWPGVGLLFIQALQAADIPVIAAYLLLTAALFVAISLLVDVACAAVDPRVPMDADGT